MSKQSIKSNKFESKIACKKCASTLRYIATNRCVSCSDAANARHNAVQYARRRATQSQYYQRYYGSLDRRLTRLATRMLNRIERQPWGNPWDHLGYTADDLKDHLAPMMAANGWTWETWGIEWSVDHIVPVSRFKRAGWRDVTFIHSLENLQALSLADNRRKFTKSMKEWKLDEGNVNFR